MSESKVEKKVTRTSFTTNINKIVVQIDGGGAEIQELNGGDMSLYMSSMASRMKMDAAGKPVGMTDYRGIQSTLIHLCLRIKDKKVAIDEIEKWPTSMVKDLYTLCQDVNGMSEDKAEELKNE